MQRIHPRDGRVERLPARAADRPGPGRPRRRRRCRPGRARRSPARPARPGNTSPPGRRRRPAPGPGTPAPARPDPARAHDDPAAASAAGRGSPSRRRDAAGRDVVAEGDLQAGLPGDPGHDHPAGGGELQPELHVDPVRPRRRPGLVDHLRGRLRHLDDRVLRLGRTPPARCRPPSPPRPEVAGSRRTTTASTSISVSPTRTSDQPSCQPPRPTPRPARRRHRRTRAGHRLCGARP